MLARHRLSLTLLAISSSACSIGKENILFTTKTSIGVDIDGQPPTFDLGYGRKEGSVAPVVESGEVLPLMASISSQVGFLNSAFGIGVSQSFAVGASALLMTRYITSSENQAEKAGIDLTELLRDPAMAGIRGTKDGSTRYFFGTDTVLGFKVSMSPSANVPDGLSFGWRRKELACVPIQEVTQFVRRTNGDYVRLDGTPMPKSAAENLTDTQRAEQLAQDTHLVIPSMLATVASNTGAGGSKGVQQGIAQFYATGHAASYLSSNPQIRKMVAPGLLGDERADSVLTRGQAVDASIEKDTAEQVLVSTAKSVVGGLETEGQVNRARSIMLGLGFIAGTEGGVMDAEWEAAELADRKTSLRSFIFADDDHPGRVELLVESLNLIAK